MWRQDASEAHLDLATAAGLLTCHKCMVQGPPLHPCCHASTQSGVSKPKFLGAGKKKASCAFTSVGMETGVTMLSKR